MFASGEHRQISEAADRLSAGLAALDLDDALPSTLTDLVALGERIERLGHGLKTLAAAKVADTSVWRRGGVRSPEDWLARESGISKAEASRTLATGRQLQELPAAAAALRRGALSAGQAEAVAGAATANPAAERALLDAAQTQTLAELKDTCARTRQAADPDPEATAKRIHRQRSYRTWTDADGVGHLHCSGPSATIARMDSAIRHRADQCFRDARRDGRREPSEAYGFDAAEAILTADGSGTPVPRGADAKIIVRVDHAALVRGRASEGEICEIAGGGPIPVSVVDEWMNDAFVAAVLTEGTDVTRVVHLGRRFTSLQRTALQWQDPICARKGCRNRLGLEYDHFEDWAATHTTRSTCAKRFCRACHRLKTLGWHVSEPDADGQCTFTPASPRAG